MAGKKRGVGYCTNRDCAVFGRLYLLLDLPSQFECPTCLRPASMERERGMHRAKAAVYDEVRVEFDFDPLLGIYKQTARIRDGRLLGSHDVYTLQSPLIHSREHAVEVGRIVLLNLNQRIDRYRHRPGAREDLVAQGWPVLV